MSFLSAKFERYGLIDTEADPTRRVFVADVHEDTEGSLRAVPDRDQDPDGSTIFAGFRSEVTIASADLDGVSQIETWMRNFEDVELVAVTPDHLVQWYNPSRLLGTEELDITETNLVQSRATMVQDGGDQQDHDVYITRNGLLSLAPQNGGWADTDSNDTPDGYTETSLNSTAWNSGVYEGFVDTGSGTGSLNVTIPFPLDNVDVTLSVQADQIHDDGAQAIRIEALDSSGSTITGGVSDVTYSTTGRKSVDLTTPSDTHQLKVYPVRVTSVSSNTTKFKIQDPALRVDGETSFVKR